MKIDRNWYLIAIAVVLASILLPFMQVNSFAGNVVESKVVYRDGWFGPYIERVTLDTGAVMHVTQYPWYYFTENNLPSMNIYGIEGSGSSNSINIVAHVGDDKVPITFKQQNDLDFTNSVNWWQDGKEVAEKSRLVMYNNIVTDTNVDLSPLTDSAHDSVITHGPFAYGETWTSTLYYWPYVKPYAHQEAFTVEETLYPGSFVGYDMDRAFVYVTLLANVDVTDPNDPIVVGGVGSINIKVLDELIQKPATVRMYQDNNLVQTVFIENGDYTFKDLEFGSYRFEVTDSDYDTYFYDAFPQQTGYDYDLGTVELSAELNTISYVIYGDFPSTDGSAFDSGDGLLPDYSNTTTGEILDDIVDVVKGDSPLTNDDGLPLAQILGMIAALLSSIGLLTSVAVIGLPIFIVVILFLLIAAFVKSGDKKSNYSPGNKKGGRKR